MTEMRHQIEILGNKEAYTLGSGLQHGIAHDVIQKHFSQHRLAMITDHHLETQAQDLFRVVSASSPIHVVHYPTALSAKATSTANSNLLIVLPAGEETKCRRVKDWIEDLLLEHAYTRQTCILALGGGVIGDLSGYVASTFMRGVPVVQLPTTLLAMVDSAIGGKTAIDTPHGKNLIGAFWQPSAIVADIRFLYTLPLRQLVNGMAEVIKTAAFWDADFFSYLEQQAEDFVRIAKLLEKHRSKGMDPLTCLDAADSQVFDMMLQKMIQTTAGVKAYVVTHDERESGLRGLLNFGHSVGHAIEAILTPDLLHGEAIAVGMVKEGEIARFLGHFKQENLARLVRCLKAYGLPSSMEDPLLVQLEERTGRTLRAERLIEIMKVDKKNQGTQKRIVLLSGIGRTLEPKASNVSDDVIIRALAPAIRVGSMATMNTPLVIDVPGSKSISNRVLILAALSHGECRIRGLLHSDDTQVMLTALEQLRACTYRFEEDGMLLIIRGSGGQLQLPPSSIYLGNAGTAMRFLTSVCTLIPPTPETTGKWVTVTGNARMQQRPIAPLVEALNAAGCRIRHANPTQCPPLDIEPTGLAGGRIQLSASISSQYVSSILLAAPFAREPVILDLGPPEAHVVSQPYIDMTIAMMKTFGVQVVRDTQNPNQYVIPNSGYQAPSSGEYIVEPDASSATYPLSIAGLTGNTVIVPNLDESSCQGDAQFAWKVLKPMGCHVESTPQGLLVQGPKPGTPLRGLGAIDMESMTDAFLTASVLAAMTAKGDETVIHGIANQRVKECNRILAMVTELGRFGVEAWEVEDGIGIRGMGPSNWTTLPAEGIDCYDDHRVAMSFAVLASNFVQSPAMQAGLVIREKKCVEKTWPTWWDVLQNKFGCRCEGVDQDQSHGHNKPSKQSDKSVILVGMRGVGKTNLGRAAASALGWQFIDLDCLLEQRAESTIPQIIQNEGWTRFRELETETFEFALNEYRTRTIIASGGGLVEATANQDLLRRWTQKGGLVVHLRRNISDVASYLGEDATRPSYGQDVFAVWEQRKPLYELVCNLEFWAVKTDTQYQWPSIENALVTMLQRQLDPSPPLRLSSSKRVITGDGDNHSSSFFVSLTLPDLRQHTASLRHITEGADAVEFRVDLLSNWEDLGDVAEQLAVLRQYTSLPVVFTVRSQSQGGRFPNDLEEHMFALLHRAILWGCEYVDVETCWPQSRLESLRSAAKGRCLLIASYHDLSNKDPWNAPVMAEQLRIAAMYGDVVKLIATASNLQDNFALYEALAPGSTSCLGRATTKPIIAMNMGQKGQMSRVLNHTLTPVTHADMPSKAAPGQLSVPEIHQARHLLGVLPKKQFHLFGSPIALSCSPCLHNTGFHVLGLPHSYGLFEACTVTEELKALWNSPQFGGASVTIPLKELVIPFMNNLTHAAERIGAVNTIMVEQDSTQGHLLVGDNTDYLGIMRCIKQSGKTPKRALVIGAGGTAKAACFAVQQLGASLLIWNRTPEKAVDLAHRFGGQVVADLSEHLEVDLVVSTVPGYTHEQLPFAQKASQLFQQWSSTGVFIELAYSPRRTILLEAADGVGWHVTEGIQVLIEQGAEQFQRWTGRHAPIDSIRPVVYQEYANKVGQ